MGCTASRARAVLRGYRARVAKVETGRCWSSASAGLGVSWKSQVRVRLWAPSQPIRRVPVSVVLSVKVAVTEVGVVVMVASFLLYCGLLV